MDTLASTPPESSPRASARIHYIDWLRVIAILMVFLFHAVHPFDLSDWEVKNVDQSEALTILLTFLAQWGMPFFFLVAGASSWFALKSRSPRKYLSERFYRLLIPFFVGTILFSPIENYCQNLNRIQRGVQSSFQSYLSAFSLFNPLSLRFPGFSPAWFGLGYHLWFLGFLFSFALITLPFFIWLKNGKGQNFIAWMAGICARRAGILLWILPATLIYSLLLPFFPKQHDWADFIYLLFFFVLGFILFADERFTRAIRRDWAVLLVAGTAAFLSLMVAYLLELPVVEWSENPALFGFYLIQFLRSVIAVCFVLVMLFVGMRFLDFSNGWLRYGQEAALPFFVLHQPVIIVIAFFVVQWEAGLLVKLLIVMVSSFLVTLGLYEGVVRRVNFLRLAFGMKARSSGQVRLAGL